MNTTISLKELLEAGCHFGHQAQRWNPKAASYIYTERDGIHIIDLAKTKDGILAATSYLSELITQGGKVLFVGTKRQAREIIKNEAKRSGTFYISERWPAGLLTNFEVIKKNLKKMKDIKDKLISEEVKANYTKKEIGLWEKELAKLEMVYGGIAELTNIPDAMFVIDVKKEDGAVKEGKKRGVTIIGMVDTNSDQTPIDYPIPANDDAVGSITIVTKYIADAVEEAMKIRQKKLDEQKEEELKVPLRGKQSSHVNSKEFTVQAKLPERVSSKFNGAGKTKTKDLKPNKDMEIKSDEKETKEKDKEEEKKETKVSNPSTSLPSVSLVVNKTSKKKTVKKATSKKK